VADGVDERQGAGGEVAGDEQLGHCRRVRAALDRQSESWNLESEICILIGVRERLAPFRHPTRSGSRESRWFRTPVNEVHPMKPVFLLLGIVSLLAMLRPAQAAEVKKKLRTIATTDGEIDDRCSMIRFLLYANEWDIRGIVHSSSMYHWKGDANHPRHNWEDESWLDRQLDAYTQVYPSLKANEAGYPTPDYLRSQVFVGNVGYEGDMDAPTAGSDRIVDVLLDPDPSPVWLQAWGGSNTIARALKTIEEKHPDRVEAVSRKAKLFLISVQDNTMDTYILKRWPKVELILSTAFGALAYSWQKIMSPEEQAYFDAKWMKANLLEGHGPLCAMYEAQGDGRFRSEGDSPSFMHLIDVGLGAHLDPTWGGWGGRFARKDNKWVSALDDRDLYKSLLRWAPAFQNDWAARADWCVKPIADCNHPPAVVCNGDATNDVLRLTVDPGAEVKLSAAGTADPDGDTLSYKWGVYRDAGTYWEAPPLRSAEARDAALTVPVEASGRTIHVILEVTDDGAPPLTRCRRVVLAVSGEPQPKPEDKYLTTPITQLTGPPADTGKWTFFRGVNVNGPALTIDGNLWEGDEAVDYVCKDSALNTPQVTLRPPTDDARAKMIHSFRWSSNPTLTLTNVPAGTYAVYASLWEDNNPETFTLSLNGQVVARNHCSGVTGEWHRLGPWRVDVADGKLALTGEGGAANVAGIEVWRKEQ